MGKIKDSKRGAKILIAEVDNKLAKGLREVITQLGYSVAGISASGSDAIKSAIRLNPSIVIISSNLKGSLNEIETAKRINKNYPAEFIFVLEHFDSKKINSLKKSFQSEFIINPITKPALKTALEITLQKLESGKKLRYYEDKFNSIYSNTPALVITLNGKGIVTSVSNQLLKLFGYKTEKITGQKFINLLSDDSKKLLNKKILPKLFKNGTINTAAITIKQAGGKFLDMLLNATREVNPVTGDESYVCVLTDISEVNRATKMLRLAEEKYKGLIERMQDGVFIVNNGLIDYANSIVAATLGYKISELKGKKLSDIVAPEEYEIIFDRYTKRISGKRVPNSYETKLLKKSGEPVIVNLTVGLLEIEGEKLAIGTVKDITQSKLTYDALIESEQRFKTFYENTFIGIYRTSPQGRIIMANPALIAMLGYNAFADLAYHNRIDIGYAPAYDRKWFRDVMEKEGQIIGHEAQWMKADKSFIWVRESAKAVYDGDGNVIYYDGTVENITEKKLTDQALQKSEKRFHSLFTNMVEGAALHHLVLDSNNQPINYIIVDVNPEYEKIIRLKRDEVTGKLATDIYKTTEPPYLKEYSSTVMTGLSLQFEAFFEPTNTYFIISVAPWGEHGFATIFSDITQRKLAEEALRLSEDRYRAFVQQSTEGIWCFALNTPLSIDEPINNQLDYILQRGYLMECNDAYAQMYGLIHARQIIGTHLSELFAIRNSKESDYLIDFIKSGYKISDVESHEIDSDGKSVYILNNLVGIITDGKLTHAWGTRRDITGKKHFEQELRNLSRAVEQSPSSIIITDTKGNIEYVNPKFCEVTGYSVEEIIGKNPRVLKSEYKSNADYKEMWKTITSGNQWHGEFLNKKKSGELFWEQASISPITNDEGVVTSYLAVKEDVTQRKRFEEELIRAKEAAEKADKMKSEFLAQMSHEIRTPLNNILTYIGLIREEFEQKLPAGMESSFKIIDNSSQRLIRTIELILNLSEIQTGNFRVKKEVINLDKDILENISLEFYNRAHAKNLELVYENKTDNGKIIGDSYSIAQIFNNLLENAIKYTNHGRVDMVLFERDEKICVEIKDTGIGISAEYLPNLFSPFTQEEMGYTRRFEGNGLGLSLVQKYVEINGAEIVVESQKQKGSTFRVMFHRKP